MNNTQKSYKENYGLLWKEIERLRDEKRELNEKIEKARGVLGVEDILDTGEWGAALMGNKSIWELSDQMLDYSMNTDEKYKLEKDKEKLEELVEKLDEDMSKKGEEHEKGELEIKLREIKDSLINGGFSIEEKDFENRWNWLAKLARKSELKNLQEALIKQKKDLKNDFEKSKEGLYKIIETFASELKVVGIKGYLEATKNEEKIKIIRETIKDLRKDQAAIEASGKDITTLLEIEKKIANKLGKNKGESWGPNWEKELEKKIVEKDPNTKLVADYRAALEEAGITTSGKSADKLKEDAKILQEAHANLEKINKELSLLIGKKEGFFTTKTKKVVDEKKLTEYSEALKKVNQLQANLTTATEKITTLNEQITALTAEKNARPDTDLEAYKQLKTDLTDAQTQIENLTKQITALSTRPDTTQAAYDELQTQLKTAQDNIKTLTAERNAANTKADTLQTELTAAENDYQEASKNIQKAEKYLKMVAGSLATLPDSENDSKKSLTELLNLQNIITNAEKLIKNKLGTKIPNAWKLTDANCQNVLAAQNELDDISTQKSLYESILKNDFKLVDNNGKLLKSDDIKSKLGGADFSQLPEINSHTHQKATLSDLIAGFDVDSTKLVDLQTQLTNKEKENQTIHSFLQNKEQENNNLQTQLKQAQQEKEFAEKKEQNTLQFINQQIRLGLEEGTINKEEVISKIKQLIANKVPREQLVALENQTTDLQNQLNNNKENIPPTLKDKVKEQVRKTNNSNLIRKTNNVESYQELVDIQSEVIIQTETKKAMAEKWNVILVTLSAGSLVGLLAAVVKMKSGGLEKMRKISPQKKMEK